MKPYINKNEDIIKFLKKNVKNRLMNKNVIRKFFKSGFVEVNLGFAYKYFDNRKMIANRIGKNLVCTYLGDNILDKVKYWQSFISHSSQFLTENFQNSIDDIDIDVLKQTRTIRIKVEGERVVVTLLDDVIDSNIEYCIFDVDCVDLNISNWVIDSKEHLASKFIDMVKKQQDICYMSCMVLSHFSNLN